MAPRTEPCNLMLIYCQDNDLIHLRGIAAGNRDYWRGFTYLTVETISPGGPSRITLEARGLAFERDDSESNEEEEEVTTSNEGDTSR